MLNTLKEECSKLGYFPRKIQLDAVDWLDRVWESKNKCKILSLPVGSGKSLVAKTIAEHNSKQGKVTAIITPQNVLIDQYINEFKELNYMKGKAHYSCEGTKSTCDVGLEIEKSTKKKCSNCPYRMAKERCYSENITIFNPLSYFVLPKLKLNDEGFEPIYEADTIIIDEFQTLPSMLRELTSIKLWRHDIKFEKGVSSSIISVIDILEKYVHKLYKFILNDSIDKKEKTKFLILQRRIDYIVYQLKEDSKYFICEEIKEKYKGQLEDCLLIRPKYVPPKVLSNFFKLVDKVVLMSGTAFPHLWQELGFHYTDYIDLNSPIDKERRPIFVTNSVSVSAKLDNFKRQNIIENIAAQIKYISHVLHAGENGVVLLPYNLAKEIKHLLHEKHFIHMDKNSKKEVIDLFKSGKEYLVGIFSGSYEGISLDNHLSRFTIIPKVTFPNLLDKVVQIRMQENNLNYSLETMTTMIQASGRSTRSERDYSFTYILDSNFIRLYSKTRSFLPKYFKESLVFSLPKEEHINKLNEFRGELYENRKIA